MGVKANLLGTEWGHEREELLKTATSLINPVSGIANDFLNQYNEVLLFVENLPVLLPEMVEEFLAWRPKTYQEYFSSSSLPGSATAVRIYHNLDRSFRGKFETQVGKVNKLAFKAIAVISEKLHAKQELNSEDIEEYCTHISKKLRAEIEKANMLVNHGLNAPLETSQEMADRLMRS